MQALACPQCGGALPKQARWRTVQCPFCDSSITLARNVVHAAEFRAAWLRTKAAASSAAAGKPRLQIQNQTYQVQAQLGFGEHHSVLLAERLGPLAERVVIKLAHADLGAGASAAAPAGATELRLQHETQILQQLQADTSPPAAYFSQRLPQAVCFGSAKTAAGAEHAALVFRHPTGFWGSLDVVRQHYPKGVDARHIIWMWRRVLEVLGYLHDIGWAHGRITPDHLLVHPRDHGILLIGWAKAQFHAKPDPAACVRDLMQSAAAISALMPVDAPKPLLTFMQNGRNDPNFCQHHGARGLDRAIKDLARTLFGPARFVEFNPDPH